MAQGNGTPAARRPLFALPAVTEPVPGNAGQHRVTEPVTGSVTLPLTPLTVTGNAGEPVTETPAGNTAVVPLTPVEHGRLAVAHWASTAANGAGQLWLNPGRLGHALYHGRPGSIAGKRAYVKSHEWVPPELDGKAAKVIGGVGVIFHMVAGLLQIPLLILYVALDRPLRSAGLVAFLIVFIVFVLPHIPLI